MNGQRDPKFYSELKQLNEDLLEYLKLSHEKSPFFNFSPPIKDYVKQFADLDKQYPPKQPLPTMQPFLFGAPPAPSSVLQAAPTSNTSFFSFTLPPKREEDSSSSSSNNNKDTGNSLAGGADNNAADEDTPPEPRIDKYEEPDAKHSAKCKSYEKAKGVGSEVKMNLLGIGTTYVKALDAPNKLQVIVRQEPDLRRVLLNEVITSNIPVKLLPKAVQMILPGQNGEIRFYVIKVKDEAEANKLYEMLNFSKS